MAVIVLNNAQTCNEFFRRRILINLRFWLGYIGAKPPDATVLESERDAIIRAISFALDLEEAWARLSELITTCSPYMERGGYWEAWSWVLNRAIEAARRAEDVSGEATLSALSARLLQWQSRFSQAVGCYRHTIRLARQIGDQFNEARACSNLGYIFIEKGCWHRAEVLCCHALTLFERLDSSHGRAHTENHLGILFTWQRCWDPARRHLERACALWQSMGDHHGLMRGYINLGILYIEMKQPKEALHYLEKALNQARRTGDEAELGKIYTNMGIAHRHNGEPAKAEALARQAEAIFRRFSNSLGLAQVWDNLGLACIDQEKWEEALEHLNTSLVAWRHLKIRYGEIRTLLYLAKYEIARGDRSKAARQLDEVERLIGEHAQEVQGRYLQSLLGEYRRSLPGQAAAGRAGVD